MLEGGDLGSDELLVHAALAAIPVDVGELVHTQSVLLIEGNVVELPDGRVGLGGGGELDEGEPATSASCPYPTSSVCGHRPTLETGRPRPWA